MQSKIWASLVFTIWFCSSSLALGENTTEKYLSDHKAIVIDATSTQNSFVIDPSLKLLKLEIAYDFKKKTPILSSLHIRRKGWVRTKYSTIDYKNSIFDASIFHSDIVTGEEATDHEFTLNLTRIFANTSISRMLITLASESNAPLDQLKNATIRLTSRKQNNTKVLLATQKVKIAPGTNGVLVATIDKTSDNKWTYYPVAKKLAKNFNGKNSDSLVKSARDAWKSAQK